MGSIMLQYAGIDDLIQFTHDLVEVPDLQLIKVAYTITRAYSMFNGLCNRHGYNTFTNSSLLKDPPILLKDLEI